MSTTTKVTLTTDVEDVGKSGQSVELESGQANDLVSAGQAVQDEPFVITESHTSGPPWSPEKLERSGEPKATAAVGGGPTPEEQQAAKDAPAVDEEAAERRRTAATPGEPRRRAGTGTGSPPKPDKE